MYSWEDMRKLVYVVGGFLVIYLLVYLIILGPNSTAVNELESNFESQVGKEFEKYFPEDPEGARSRVSFLQNLYTVKNRDLEERLALLEKHLSRGFPEPLIPEDKLPHRQSYVRDLLREFQNEIKTESALRNVSFSARAETLGLDLPNDTNEEFGQDISWLEQIYTTLDAVKLLLTLSEEDDGSKNLLTVEKITPAPGVKAGPPPSFIREFDIELTVVMNLRGVMRLLAVTGKAESFLLVEKVEILAETNMRTGRSMTVRSAPRPNGDIQERRWTEHFYRVKLRLVRLVVGDVAEAAAKPAAADRPPAEERRIAPIVY